MSDFLDWYKEIETHQKLVFSRRFLPTTLLFGIGVISGLFNHNWWFSGKLIPFLLILIWAVFLFGLYGWATRLMPFEKTRLKKINQQIAQLNWEESQLLLDKVYPLRTPVYNIKKNLVQVRLLKYKGFMLEAYVILKNLLLKPLLSKERNIVNLAQAWLYFDVGNYRDARATFNRINNTNLEDLDEKVCYYILDSHLAEVNNNFKTAKAKLEQMLDDATIDDTNKASIYHDLARLEDAQGNLNTAIDYYNEAWRILKTGEYFLQTNVTASNLILLHARSGNVVKACKILSEYGKLVDVSNPNQLLELNNREIELSRQIDDKSLLSKVYKTSDEMIFPKLTKEEQLNLLVSEMRMRFCDDMNFETHLVKTMWHLVDTKNLELLHQLAAYKEMLDILKQAICNIGSRPDLMIYHGWITLQFIQQESLLDAQRTEIPPSLPSYREQCLRLKLELIKIKIFLCVPAIQKQVFNSLFATLTELKNIWSDKDNAVGEMNGLVVLLDEYVAYSEQLNDIQFRKDYSNLVYTTLERAETLLQATWQQHAMHEYTAGLAWFWFKIDGNKDKAGFWLNRFESKNLSLNHFKPWYRELYKKTKTWLTQ